VTGERIIAFSPEWRPFTYLSPDRYTSPDARDAFVRDLQAVRLYPPEFAPKSGMNGKGAERDLVDLSDDEFERLLNSLANYCAEKQAGRTLNIAR